MGGAFTFGIGKAFRESKEIVGGNVKEKAQCLDIFHTGLVFTALNVRNLPLGHMDSFAKFCLIEFTLLPEQPDLFSKTDFHAYHRVYFTIDAIFLLIFR